MLNEQQLDELLARMSLRDKARQLSQVPVSAVCADRNAAITGSTGSEGLTQEDLNGIGSALNFSGVQAARAAHRTHGQHSDVPLLLMQDVIHGYRTVFPVNLAMAGTFDPALVEACAAMSAREARANGVHVTFAPMADLARDARWGRVMESSGEDPYLNGVMSRAYVRGYHQGGIACCVKHFAAYGAAEGGRDYNTTDVSEHTLHEYYLRGYEAAIKEKPEMVMTSFNALNGIPLNGHRELLIDLLREQWGFDGLVISDYNAVLEMINHGYTANEKECAEVALNNEVDIEMVSTCYVHHLEELVQAGKLSEETVDRMVRRVLRLKNKLGLFDDPEVGIDAVQAEALPTAEHRALACRAAEKACVLLKNSGVLPLRKDAAVALIGPFAQEQNLLGNWGCVGRSEEVVTVREGIETLLGHAVPVAEGCTAELLDTDEGMIPQAVEVAKGADIIVACVGEQSKDSGEGASRADITLPMVQRKLIHALRALGKPLVLVVFGGRPQVLTDVEQDADAILYAWHPGTEGGNAIARLIYGAASPSGKLAMSFPRTTGQCPLYYNAMNTGRPRNPDTMDNKYFVSAYRDTLNAPLYPFGYGLTYTTCELGPVSLSQGTLRPGEAVQAKAMLRNTGDCPGEEVVQLYIRDRVASCVRPVKELKAFRRVALNPGEAVEVVFDVTEDMLAFHTASGAFAAEPGVFDIMLGLNSASVTSQELTLLNAE
ncbi:MAG: glycoside hydrolase family 3 N-terminal domain-containing protein [Aristaeellaceae bacterium]